MMDPNIENKNFKYFKEYEISCCCGVLFAS